MKLTPQAPYAYYPQPYHMAIQQQASYIQPQQAAAVPFSSSTANPQFEQQAQAHLARIQQGFEQQALSHLAGIQQMAYGTPQPTFPPQQSNASTPRKIGEQLGEKIGEKLGDALLGHLFPAFQQPQ